ncbi:MAG: hypothetical protein C0498_01460 [Anaerolinea sp.]|nr:hypothetical protein [Anaerolinea sp.]
MTSDAAFAEYVSDLVFPAHLWELSRFLDRHPKGVVLEPRGHAKTTALLHRAARLVGVHRGQKRIGVLTSVGGDAMARSRAIRSMVESPKFAEVFEWAQDGVTGDKWTDAEWTVKGVALGKDHSMLTDALLSAKPGPRLDILIGDDIVGRTENTTAGQRQRASEAYWQVVDPMVVPDGVRWFAGTRWHEDDFYAELIRKGWPHLVRKALGDDGSTLWPELWGMEALLAKRLDMGSALYDLQYQNDPSGMGGNIFKREWFGWVDNVPEGGRRFGLDLASSTSERSDYTAGVEAIETPERDLYIVGAWQARLDEGHRLWLTGRQDDGTYVETAGSNPAGPRLLWPMKLLPAGFVGWRAPHPVAAERARELQALNIEATQHQGTFVREVLRNTRLPAMPVYPDKDKVTRARALAARFEGRKVSFLRGGPGLGTGPTDLGELPSQLLAFPNGEHDDLVDAAVYAADLGGTEFYFTSASR